MGEVDLFSNSALGLSLIFFDSSSVPWKIAARTSWAVLGQVSRNGSINTSWAQQCYTRWTSTWVFILNNSNMDQIKPQLKCSSPIICEVIFIVLHQVSFYIFATSKLLFTCVCFCKSSFHMCAPAKHHLAWVTFQIN